MSLPECLMIWAGRARRVAGNVLQHGKFAAVAPFPVCESRCQEDDFPQDSGEIDGIVKEAVITAGIAELTLRAFIRRPVELPWTQYRLTGIGVILWVVFVAVRMGSFVLAGQPGSRQPRRH